MPLYISAWLRCKYMPNDKALMPISLPWLTHPAGQIVYQRLVYNSEIKCLTHNCFSNQMFSMDLGDVPEDRLSDFPSNDAMKNFVAIALPKPHYYNGVWIGNEETLQLNGPDASKFVSIIIEEFWRDHDEWWAEKMKEFKKKHPDRHFSYYDSLLDFMEFWQIPFDYEEALYRAAKRRKEALKMYTPPSSQSSPLAQ